MSPPLSLWPPPAYGRTSSEDARREVAVLEAARGAVQDVRRDAGALARSNVSGESQGGRSGPRVAPVYASAPIRLGSSDGAQSEAPSRHQNAQPSRQECSRARCPLSQGKGTFRRSGLQGSCHARGHGRVATPADRARAPIHGATRSMAAGRLSLRGRRPMHHCGALPGFHLSKTSNRDLRELVASGRWTNAYSRTQGDVSTPRLPDIDRLGARAARHWSPRDQSPAVSRKQEKA